MCQEVKCTQQTNENPRGFFWAWLYLFPGLYAKADSPSWVACWHRWGRGSYMDPKHHQLQWYLHPQAELLSLMMPFTHSCKAFRQGQALSPITSEVWQEPAARDLWQTCTLPSAWPRCCAFSSADLWGPHVSRYFHRGVLRVLCCGWHLSWVAFLSEGSPFILRWMELHSPF